MSLDVFNPAASDQDVTANAAANLPADFSEAFDVAWRSGTEFNNSAAYTIARERALTDYNDQIYQKTGERLPWLGYGPEDASIDQFNDAQTKLQQKVPGLDYLTPLSEGDINAMTLRRMAKAHADAAAFSNRETSWSGTAGTVLGTLTSGLADPVMAATAPLGGAGELGIGLRALEFAGISGGSTAVSAGLGVGSREAAVPGSSKEIPGEILGATLGGAALGGAFGILGKVLSLGAKTLPTTVRDEVNAAASEYQFHATNPFPTAAGETAARDATVDAATSLVKGDKVTAANDFDARHVADYALAAEAKTPEELALAGEQHLRPETFAEKPDVQAFDRMPSETDDAASYWDKRLEAASPEEKAALGATDGGRAPSFETAVEINGKSQTKGSYVAYHGTHAVFDDFNDNFQGTGVGAPYTEGKGHFFATDPELASGYAEGTFGAGNVKRVRINLDDLEAVPFERHGISDLSSSDEDIAKLIDAAQEKGRDGLVLKDVGGKAGNHVIVAFDGESVKGEPFGSAFDVPARDVPQATVDALAVDPKTDDAVLRNLDRIRVENPDAQFTTQVRQPDGSFQLVSRPLEDVMDELDSMETLGKELEACAVGMEAAE